MIVVLAEFCSSATIPFSLASSTPTLFRLPLKSCAWRGLMRRNQGRHASVTGSATIAVRRRLRRVPDRPHSDEPRARRDRLAHRRQGRGQSVPATTRADPSGAARLGRDRLPFLLCCNDAIEKHRSTRGCRQAATGLSKARGQARMGNYIPSLTNPAFTPKEHRD